MALPPPPVLTCKVVEEWLRGGVRRTLAGALRAKVSSFSTLAAEGAADLEGCMEKVLSVAASAAKFLSKISQVRSTTHGGSYLARTCGVLITRGPGMGASELSYSRTRLVVGGATS